MARGFIVVRLFDARYGAGPGRVERLIARVEDYSAHDRDGATDPMLRLWSAYDGVEVGDVCALPMEVK